MGSCHCPWTVAEDDYCHGQVYSEGMSHHYARGSYCESQSQRSKDPITAPGLLLLTMKDF